MEKKFTKFELAAMKRTAQNVDRYITKKNKLKAQIEELEAEYNATMQLLELTDAPTRAMTGGYGTEDIIKKVITPTDKTDKNGVLLKVTSYEFIYPDTIVPPVIEVPETTGNPGSDFDLDAEVEIKNEESVNNIEINPFN